MREPAAFQRSERKGDVPGAPGRARTGNLQLRRRNEAVAQPAWDRPNPRKTGVSRECLRVEPGSAGQGYARMKPG